MEYRIKEIVRYGKSFYYPQYKKRWFWRRFVWLGGEDGTTPYTVFYNSMSNAIECIEAYKKRLEEKAAEAPKQVVYHPVH